MLFRIADLVLELFENSKIYHSDFYRFIAV